MIRRSAGFLLGIATGTVIGGAAMASCCSLNAPVATEVPPFNINAVRSDIDKIIQGRLSYGPRFVRLAWHNAVNWDSKKKDGCPNMASMRFKPESDYPDNGGLDVARDALEPVKQQHPKISYADLWVLASYVAIKRMGGPDIEFYWGRTDAKDSSQCAPNRLPDGAKTQDHVRSIFDRLGFNDREAVALVGAHTCGECRKKSSGFDGPWSHQQNTFDNDFFIRLLEEEWELNTTNARLQFKDRSTGKLMMLPSDVCLLLDPEYRKYVEMYAKDNALFLKDFASAFKRVTELGTTGLYSLPLNLRSNQISQL